MTDFAFAHLLLSIKTFVDNLLLLACIRLQHFTISLRFIATYKKKI